MPRQASSAAHPLTDHEEIRSWAEERGGKPSCVRGTGGESDVGMIRIDFPGYSGEGSLEEISWDDWFDKFDERNLALLVQEETAGGQQSNFNKLVSRSTAESARGRSRTRGSSRSQARGRTRKSATARGRNASRSGRSSRRATSATSRQGAASSRRQSRNSRSASAGRRSNRSTQVRGKKVNGSAHRSSRRRAA